MPFRKTSRWEDFFSDVGLEYDLTAAYLTYIATLEKHDRPVIFSFSHLAALLGRTNDYLASAIHCPDAHYRAFTIPKRNGQLRDICAPYPALLECQQWINRHVFATYDVHARAHGFVSGRSIKTNARVHLKSKHLLKMDLQDFFPSIGIRRVIGMFKRFGYASNVAFYLSRLCTLKARLPQGAATSPTISNVLAYRLDERLDGLASACKLKYSRYADDLTFSGGRIGVSFPDLVKRIVEEEGFRVRDDKTRLSRGHGQRIVTGISIDQGSLRVPRRFRRELRKEVHYVNKYGLMSHITKLKIRRPYYVLELYGKLRFWQWVEPRNLFAHNALESMRILMTELRVD
jgi:retron-type reverse transcriptase